MNTTSLLSQPLATVAYIGATILFIMSLGGLSHPRPAAAATSNGIIGMAIAVLATIFGPRVTPRAGGTSSAPWRWAEASASTRRGP